MKRFFGNKERIMEKQKPIIEAPPELRRKKRLEDNKQIVLEIGIMYNLSRETSGKVQ